MICQQDSTTFFTDVKVIVCIKSSPVAYSPGEQKHLVWPVDCDYRKKSMIWPMRTMVTPSGVMNLKQISYTFASRYLCPETSHS